MKSLRFLATALLTLACGSAAFAAEKEVPLTKSDIPALVKQALMDDPEMIMQALEKLRSKKAEEQRRSSTEALEKNKDELFSNKDLPSTGASAKNAEVTIVEFFDYHCGYCKHFLPTITQAVEKDKTVRVVFVDLPILSEDSALAARAAIAVNRLNKDKYFAFHTALMKESGKFDEAKLLEVAKTVGVKGDLKAEMAKPEVTAQLDKNRALAAKLNISGTPGIVLGNTIIPGALSYDELKGQIEIARKANKE